MDSRKDSNTSSFDSFIDMDLCTDNASNAIDPHLLSIEADQEMPALDFSNMNQADLFKYFLDGELTPQQAANLDAIASAAASSSSSSIGAIAPADLTALSFQQKATISPSASPLSSVEMQFEDDSMDLITISSSKLFESPLDILQLPAQEKAHPQIKQEKLDTKGKAPQKAILMPPIQMPTPSPQILSSLPADVQQLLAKLAEADAKPFPAGNDTSVPPQGLDDRPSTAELKKMSSKERRQLRNKISARNFRVRRKEYITTLEEQVAEQHREMQILRMALLRIQEDNVSLRAEVETLKSKNSSITSSSNSPASASSSVNTSAVAASTPSTPASPSMKKLGTKDLAKPNLNKDRSISGASVGWKMGGHSPFMSVHTTLVPDITLSEKQLYERPCLEEKQQPAKANALQQVSMAAELGFSSDRMAWLAYSTMSWFANLYQGFVDEDDEHLSFGWNSEQELLREEAETKQKASLREMVW